MSNFGKVIDRLLYHFTQFHCKSTNYLLAPLLTSHSRLCALFFLLPSADLCTFLWLLCITCVEFLYAFHLLRFYCWRWCFVFCFHSALYKLVSILVIWIRKYFFLVYANTVRVRIRACVYYLCDKQFTHFQIWWNIEPKEETNAQHSRTWHALANTNTIQIITNDIMARMMKKHSFFSCSGTV